MGSEVSEVAAADMGQFHTLEIVPDPLVRSEDGRVARRLFKMETLGRPAAQTVPDGPSAMDGRAVPDEDDPARGLRSGARKKPTTAALS
jgi:hypothetical protein